jgi:hypothetical protein
VVGDRRDQVTLAHPRTTRNAQLGGQSLQLCKLQSGKSCTLRRR